MNTFGSALLILQGGEDGILSWSFTRAAAYVLCESRVFVEHLLCVWHHSSWQGAANTTGTKITYCPDKKVYGEYFIELDKLRQMLQELSYFSKGLRISLKVDDNDEEIFQSKNGLIDGLDNKNAISKPSIKPFLD